MKFNILSKCFGVANVHFIFHVVLLTVLTIFILCYILFLKEFYEMDMDFGNKYFQEANFFYVYF